MARDRELQQRDAIDPERGARLEAMIRDGEISTITFDNSNFDRHGRVLDKGLFKELEQFRAADTLSLVISAVVLREIRQHLADAHTERLARLKALPRLARQYLRDAIDMDALERAVEDMPAGEKWADDEIEAFLEATGATVLETESVQINQVLDRYFSRRAPFASNGAKKAEFPDAIALQSLEDFAVATHTGILVVSLDGDWARFCSDSPSGYLHHVHWLPTALNLVSASQDGRRERTHALLARLNDQLASGDLPRELFALFKREIQGRGLVKAAYPGTIDVTAEIMRAEPNRCYYVGDPIVVRRDPKRIVATFEMQVHCTFHAQFSFYPPDSDVPYAQTNSQRGELIDTFVVADVTPDSLEFYLHVPDENLVIDFDPVNVPDPTAS